MIFFVHNIFFYVHHRTSKKYTNFLLNINKPELEKNTASSYPLKLFDQKMIVEQDPENASLKIIRQTKAITIIALVKQHLIKPYKNIRIVIINYFANFFVF